MNRISRPISDDLISFTRHIASTVRMKLPLVSTLQVMAREAGTARFSNMIKDITAKVEQGMPLSRALDSHPEEFPEYYRRMVAAGEAGNTLGEVMEQLANQVEASYQLNKRIRAAFAYPSIVGVLIIADLFVAGSIGIFPRYKMIFQEMGATLNPITMIVLTIGDRFFFSLGVVFLLIGVLVGLFYYAGYARAGKGKITRDKLILHFPLIGMTARKAAAARFSRTLGSLLRGNIPLPEALKLTANTLGNEAVRQAVLDVHDRVVEGETLGKQMGEIQVFPPTMVWLISQGEEKGELIRTLDHLADFYDIQVETSIQVATSVFEPIVIIILGIVVTFFVAALYLPLFNIINVIR